MYATFFSHYSHHAAKYLQKNAKQGKILMMKEASSLQVSC
jgi:hypothetical protein